MFPKERATLIGVTAEAGFVDAVLHQQFWPCRSMRIVAVRAGNLAGRNRMSGQVMYLCALRLVTGKTDITLAFPGKRFVLGLMNFVAGGARHVVTGVRAALPVGALAGLMAIEAGAALHFSRRFVHAAEHEIRGRSCRDIIRMPHVRAAGAMACLAPRLPGNPVTRAMNRQDRFALVRAVTTRADRITAGAGGECGGCIGRVGVCRENNFTNGPSDGEREPDDKRMQAAGICVSPGHACSLMQALLLHEDRSGKLMPSLISPPN